MRFEQAAHYRRALAVEESGQAKHAGNVMHLVRTDLSRQRLVDAGSVFDFDAFGQPVEVALSGAGLDHDGRRQLARSGQYPFNSVGRIEVGKQGTNAL